MVVNNSVIGRLRLSFIPFILMSELKVNVTVFDPSFTDILSTLLGVKAEYSHLNLFGNGLFSNPAGLSLHSVTSVNVLCNLT